MVGRLTYLLFGDQSLDTYTFLSGFYRTGGQGILARAFLDQANEALLREIETLGRLERSKLPCFKSLQQLNERYHAQEFKHPGLDGALLCVTQLAHYIEYVSLFPYAFFHHDYLGLTDILVMPRRIGKTSSVTTTLFWLDCALGCLQPQQLLRLPHSRHSFPWPYRQSSWHSAPDNTSRP